jgi:hypothetical protein
MKFNINHCVKVRLTDLGRRIHREKHNRIFEFAPEFKTDKFYNAHYKPKEDKNGWSIWSMCELMYYFGQNMVFGGNLPFETEIEIIEEK